MNSVPKPSSEKKMLAQQLGVTAIQLTRIGIKEARRLLLIDPDSRRLILARYPNRPNGQQMRVEKRVPKRVAKRDRAAERMVLLAGKKRWAA